MITALLVEIEVTSPAGVAEVLRFTDRAIAPLPPGDPDRPNVAFDDRLTEAPTIERALFSSITSLAATYGVGTMTLANADRGLDAYQGYTWGAITVREWTRGQAFADAPVLIAGLCAAPVYASGDQPAQVTVGLYDYRAEVSKPVQTTFYAGTNGVGGVLYEGEADGLKGQPKPLAFGNLLGAQIPAPQVNAGVMAYQLHDGAISGAEQLFDRGDAAGDVDDGDFSGAAFDAAAPAAAHYCTDLGRGLVKLNGAPVGQLTFGFKGDAPAAGGYVETAGPILARILARMGVPSERIGASVTALASAAVVGAWAADAVNGDALMTPIAVSAQAAVLPDRQGVWQAVAFGPPAASADLTLSYDQVIKVTPDETAPAPIGEVRIGWGQIWTTFSGSDLAPALKGTSSESRLAADWRWATFENPTVKARYPRTWPTVEIQTALRNEADAVALAASLGALFGLRDDGQPRRQWRVTLERSVATAALGQTIALDYPSQGISGSFLLVGEQLMRPRRDQAIWTLWG